MRIGELAKSAGVPASTIRFYESKGLMPDTQRTAAGYREYDETSFARLKMIRFGQSLGFSLDEMPKFFAEKDQGWDHDMVMQRLLQKKYDVEALLKQLNQKHDQILTLIDRMETTWSQGQCLPAETLDEILGDTEL